MQGCLKCPKCESSQTRFRVKSKDRICYSCGNSWSDSYSVNRINTNEEEKEEIKE